MDIIFICIGTNNMSGDYLGPLVGTYLKNKFRNTKKNNIRIYGDIQNPVNFKNIDKVIEIIERKYENYISVLVDAALGEKVGTIIINSGELNIGKGLNKEKIIPGDIIIKGIVGKQHNDINKNIYELKSRNLKMINDMAISIVNSISID